MSTVLRLVKFGNPDANGLYPLRLIRQKQSGEDLGSITVNSGQPSRQVFQVGADSPGGSMRPIPEGEYVLGQLEWASGVGNYGASWGSGLGPVWVSINPAPGLLTGRGDLGFHLDANRSYSPGSAGCVVFPDLSTLRKWVAWWDDKHGRPSTLTVDWGLGTVGPGKKPEPPEDALSRIKVFQKPGKLTCLVYGEAVDCVGVKVDFGDGDGLQPFHGSEIQIAIRRK